MKVLLFYAPGELTPMSPPLGLLHLDAMLKENNISSKIFYISNMFEYLKNQKDFYDYICQIVNEYVQSDTLFCGFSVMTGTQINTSIFISSVIKHLKPNIKIVWGGVHPTLIPEQVIENKIIDIVCHGEFEYDIVELAKSLEQGKDIKGIYKSSRLFDLNDLPLLHYEDLDIKRFEIPFMSPFYKFSSPKVATVELTRGCPLSCYYCVQNNFKTKFRYMSVDNVIKHLKHIKSFGYKSLIIADDNFYISHYADNVIKRIKEENLGLEIYLSIPVTKLIKMTNEDFNLLREAGVVTLGISVESGSDRMLNIMGKKHTVQMALNANKNLSGHDIIVNYNFIAGFPEEKVYDLKATFDSMMELLKDNPLSSVNIKKLIPTPNTDVYWNCVKQGMEHPKMDEWYKLMDLEWNGNYGYIDQDVQKLYKDMKPFIKRLTDFCSKRGTVFQQENLESLIKEYDLTKVW